MNKIFYGQHYIDREDITAVKKTLKNPLITTGPLVQLFEKKISNYVGAKKTIVCNSGTAALHIAFKTINLKENDVVLMPAVNFISSYSMAKQFKANIFLCDVDKYTGLITPETIIECIKKNKLKKIKCIVTMHLGGLVKNVKSFFKIKKKYKCFLIEDACHAFGSKYKDGKKEYMIGSCKHSDIACFSFHPLKAITSGEGGAITTNNNAIFNKGVLFRSHNIKKKNFWNYDIENLGFNYRLSDINCALGISQLKKINLFLKKRNIIRKFYIYKFKIFNKKIKVIDFEDSNFNSNHLLIIQLNSKKIKEEVIKFFIKKNVFLQQHYIPIYKFKFFKNSQKNKFFGSDYYFNRSVSIPIHQNLNKRDLNKVLSLFKKYFKIKKAV